MSDRRQRTEGISNIEILRRTPYGGNKFKLPKYEIRNKNQTRINTAFCFGHRAHREHRDFIFFLFTAEDAKAAETFWTGLTLIDTDSFATEGTESKKVLSVKF